MLAVLKLENTTGGAYYHSNVMTRAPTRAAVNDVDAFGGVCIAMFGDPGQLPPT